MQVEYATEDFPRARPTTAGWLCRLRNLRRPVGERPQRRVDRPIDRHGYLAGTAEAHRRAVEGLEFERPAREQIDGHRAPRPRLHLAHRREGPLGELGGDA